MPRNKRTRKPGAPLPTETGQAPTTSITTTITTALTTTTSDPAAASRKRRKTDAAAASAAAAGDAPRAATGEAPKAATEEAASASRPTPGADTVHPASPTFDHDKFMHQFNSHNHFMLAGTGLLEWATAGVAPPNHPFTLEHGAKIEKLMAKTNADFVIIMKALQTQTEALVLLTEAARGISGPEDVTVDSQTTDVERQALKKTLKDLEEARDAIVSLQAQVDELKVELAEQKELCARLGVTQESREGLIANLIAALHQSREAEVYGAML